VFLPAGSESLLPVLLDALLEPDVLVAEANAPIRVTHRRIDDHEVYFLINDGASPWSGTVSLAVEGPGERWNPHTGEMTPVDSGRRTSLRLGPYGGVFLRFRKARPTLRLGVESGTLPGLSFLRLPEVEPVVTTGEFVRGIVAADLAQSAGLERAWRARAVLTKGDVDTFAFLMFDYPEPLDLQEAACLELATWVPEGQKAPASLLVILRRDDGGQYYADTGRSLSAPGNSQFFVSLGQFQVAPWGSPATATGGMDFSAIRSIAIGWGGYYGKKGETVEFSVRAPKVGRKER